MTGRRAGGSFTRGATSDLHLCCVSGSSRRLLRVLQKPEPASHTFSSSALPSPPLLPLSLCLSPVFPPLDVLHSGPGAGVKRHRQGDPKKVAHTRPSTRKRDAPLVPRGLSKLRTAEHYRGTFALVLSPLPLSMSTTYVLLPTPSPSGNNDDGPDASGDAFTDDVPRTTVTITSFYSAESTSASSPSGSGSNSSTSPGSRKFAALAVGGALGGFALTCLIGWALIWWWRKRLARRMAGTDAEGGSAPVLGIGALRSDAENFPGWRRTVANRLQETDGRSQASVTVGKCSFPRLTMKFTEVAAVIRMSTKGDPVRSLHLRWAGSTSHQWSRLDRIS